MEFLSSTASSERWDYRCVPPYLALFYFVFVLFGDSTKDQAQMEARLLTWG